MQPVQEAMCLVWQTSHLICVPHGFYGSWIGLHSASWQREISALNPFAGVTSPSGPCGSSPTSGSVVSLSPSSVLCRSHLGFMPPGRVDFEILQHSGIFDKKKQAAAISLVVQKQHPILMTQFLCNAAFHRGPPIIPGWDFQSICCYCTLCYFRLSFWRGYSISNVQQIWTFWRCKFCIASPYFNNDLPSNCLSNWEDPRLGT